MNSTDDLEVRVTILEEDVDDLETDVADLITDDDLQDERLNIIEEIMNENSNDIDDLNTELDTTQNAMVDLQQRMVLLEATNALLLLRVDELETTSDSTEERVADLENTANTTIRELTELGNIVNTTTVIVEDHEVDIQDMTVRLTTIEEEVSGQNADIAAVVESDTEQEERISIIEDSVDTWDDRIVALEAADRDMQNRLVTLEETILTPWVACVSSPCNNGATCVDVNIDTFICLCRDGYFGMTCAQSYANTSFLAWFDYDPGSPDDPIVFNVAPLNPGGHYNVTTGIYTVPMDGIYEFMVHIWVVSDSDFSAYLEVDGVQVFHGVSLEGTYDDPFLHMSGLLSLTTGQQIWVSPSGITGMQGTSGTYYESWFAGHIVYAL